MRIRYVSGTLGMFFTLFSNAQVVSDTIKSVDLSEVVVTGSYRHAQEKKTTLTLELFQKDYLNRHFTGNLVQTLKNVPGVHSMDIGAGFSQPMIRGLGFNRIAVSENGIKQEGQQWGADHGLEIDAFNVDEVRILKGPSSLLYGSDAMGGVIEILPLLPQKENRFFGEAALLGKSVNGTVGGSLMLGIEKNAWLVRVRFSEQHYGDYHVPVDTIVYLTQLVPVYGRKLKNTAGFERNVSAMGDYRKKFYQMNIAVSNVYQKMGFFPGAHGIPDISRLEDDGNSRNIDLPYSKVNHLKVTTHQQYLWNGIQLSGDFGYQFNHREEWSAFHTHYDTQVMPAKDPDRELVFKLHTFSSSLKLRLFNSSSWEHMAGWNMQIQKNAIGGYSFLLPEYKRFTTGAFWLTTFRLDNQLSVTGGIRYDRGRIDITAFEDPYLVEYLHRQGYEEEVIQAYRWRSYPVDRAYGNYACSAGVVWTPAAGHLLKMNVGRSFRLPGVNELASNGVHHGTFRHEKGDATLSSEQGWQIDASYTLAYKKMELVVSSFASWFDNYIYLRPMGEWSVLPHAGQIYQYSGARALFMGGEINFNMDFLRHFNYRLVGEYVYTYNRDEHTALSFSPPVSMRNILTWNKKDFQLYAELQSIASQNRIARNEDRTPGACLIHLGGSIHIPMAKADIEISLGIRNLSDVKYYNHLSFYRKVEIPEPGRSFQISIKVPFKQLLK